MPEVGVATAGIGSASRNGASWIEHGLGLQLVPSPWYVPPEPAHWVCEPVVQVPLVAQHAPVAVAQGLVAQTVPSPFVDAAGHSAVGGGQLPAVGAGAARARGGSSGRVSHLEDRGWYPHRDS